MKTLFTLNEAPCGSERTYSGLRLAGMISKQEGNAVRMFLIGDAASSAHRNQKVPQGFYNVEAMPGNMFHHGGEAGTAVLAWMRAALGAAILLRGRIVAPWQS